MSRVATLTLSVLAALVLAGVAPAEPPAPIVDTHGDALPEGALARLGTVRWRLDGPDQLSASLSQDGRSLVAVYNRLGVGVWDLDTGRRTTRRTRPAHGVPSRLAGGANGRAVGQ